MNRNDKLILSRIEEQRKAYNFLKLNYNFKKLIEELQLEKEKEKYHVDKFEDIQVQNEMQEDESKNPLRETETEIGLKFEERILQGRRREKGQGFITKQKLHIGINKILEDLLADEVEPPINENFKEYYEIKVKTYNYLFLLYYIYIVFKIFLVPNKLIEK